MKNIDNKLDKTAAIVLNSKIKNRISGDFIIAADGGLKHIISQGLTPNLFIGDLDSFQKNIENFKFIKKILNSDKDFTDGEASLREAVKLGYKKIKIYGINGGRLDHIISNIKLLKLAKKLKTETVAYDYKSKIYYLDKGEYNIKIDKNSIFSLINLTNNSKISSISKNKYKLNKKVFNDKMPSLGISNICYENILNLKVKKGEFILVIIKN